MSAARSVLQGKPIIALKGRRSTREQGRRFSHGAMAGEDAVYDAAFRGRHRQGK